MRRANNRAYNVVGILLRVAVACLLGGILIDTWLVAGLFRPVIVASGSMAPALRGPHRLWTCNNCRHEFACGLESLPLEGLPAICPFCQSANDPDAGADRRGTRVTIDRSVYLWRAPRRWETVVLDCPEKERDWCVKRIAGLPGERVEIRGGDVWVDGHIARKTIDEMQNVAVLVHEARIESTIRDWHADSERLVHRRKTLSGDVHKSPIDWLEYRHPSYSATASDCGPIVDESPYDQSESGLFNPVSDVLLRCEVTCSDSGALLVRGTNCGERFTARLDLAVRRITLKQNGKVVASNDVDVPRGPFQLDWMLADRQVQLAIENRVVLRYNYPSADVAPDGLPELAIGSESSEVSLGQVQVWRDVYYTPDGAPAGQEYVLGTDEYFLLGDNSPHSQDSRWWSPSGVPSEQLIGRAIWW